MRKEDLLIKEKWKDVKNYEGLYQISNLGEIKSYYKGCKVLKINITACGYCYITLYKNKKPKRFPIHRLVAQAFIKNPNNYLFINHKDENKLNNNVNNLEWCSHKYNCNYGSRNYRCALHNWKRVQRYNRQNELIGEFPSLKEAEKITGVKYQLISRVCRGKRKTAGGSIWKYC